MTLDARLDDLRNDRAHGALDLALIGLDIARDWRAAGRSLDELADRLRGMHPSIATLANLASAIDAGRDLDELRRSLVEGNARIASRLRRLIPPHQAIVTLSNSSTVRAALPVLRPRLVVVLESLPGGEGKAMADAVKALEVRLEPDAAMGKIAAEVDCALVGVDSCDDAGNLIHKIGTLPLALCCRHAGKPFYAAGHSFKRTEHVLEPPTDPLFDLTPHDLITALVTV